MKRGILIGLVAVLAFSAILIARLPASWLAGFLPKNIQCSELGGTLWDGSCTALRAQNIALGDLNWQLRAAPLLRGSISAHVTLQQLAGNASADVDASRGGDLDAHAVKADFALDPRLLPGVPPDIRGKVHADLAHLRLEKGALAAIEGRIELRDLEKRAAQSPALGDYALTFPGKRQRAAPGELLADLDSLGGPWEVEGVLRLTRERSVVEGTIMAGAGAPPDVVRELGSLGPPDAQGRRQFSIENEF